MNPDIREVRYRVASFADLLRERAASTPDDTVYSFLTDGEEVAERLSYGELEVRTRRLAARLQAAGAEGERVLLLFNPGLDFVVAFLACLSVGAVAVPAYPPRGRRRDARLLSIAADAEPRLGLTQAALLPRLTDADAGTRLDGIEWLLTDGGADGGDDPGTASFRPPALGPDAIAFLQYTSGSTAAPKGVVVSHGNLLHNEAMIQRAFAQERGSVVVSWLPLYHDMGLIGTVLQPLYRGSQAVLMSPVAFLQRPVRWLRAISRFRSDTSGGPDFAYDLCVRRFRPSDCEGLDLSCWRVAFNGAEPVRATTLDRFAETFAPYGFRRRAFLPCYGLAEATLMVSGSSRQGPRLRRVLASELELHRVVDASPTDAGGRRLVASGPPADELRVEVVRGEDGTPLPAGRVGEIWVAGPSVARGYWGRREESEKTFGARLASGEGPFLRTGDLGFLADGALFVTGRSKDLIILRGRNLYPQDLELTAVRSHPDLRPGGAVAFPLQVEGEERLVLVAEVAPRSTADAEDMLSALRRALSEEHEVQAHALVLVRAGEVPKTSSGKVRRRACRVAYLENNLREVAHSSGPRFTAAGEPPPEVDLKKLRTASAKARRAWLRDLLLRRVGELLPDGVSADPAMPLTSLGLDSLAAVELKQRSEADLGDGGDAAGGLVPLEDLLRGASVDELATSLADRLEDGDAVTAVPERRQEATEDGEGGRRPLSEGQRALWFLQRLDEAGSAYHIVAVARTRSPLSPRALERAVTALCRRHAALRSTFGEADGEPFRRVAAPGAEAARLVDFRFRRVEGEDLSDHGETLRRLAEEAYRPFDLARGPLLRVRAVAVGAEHLLLLVVHHIVADFVSLARVVRELAPLYAAGVRDTAVELPLPAGHEPDFAAAEATYLDSPAGRAAWRFWRRRLSPLPPPLDLPLDRPRPAVFSYRGERRTWRLPAAAADRLRTLAADRRTTLFAVLLAGFQALLFRLSGQSDLAVATPASGRLDRRFRATVDYLVRPVVLRADLSDRPELSELVARARDATASALAHQNYPFARLVERLQPQRDAARSPLFQAMLVLYTEEDGLGTFALGGDGGRLEVGELELESVALPACRSQVDLTLSAVDGTDGALHGTLTYNPDLFDATSVERLLGHLTNLLDDAGRRPETPVDALALLSPAERHQALWEHSGAALHAGPATLHGLVAAQAAETPGREAVVAADGRLTYGELTARSWRLARLLAERGIGPEVRVGLALPRTTALPVTVLAVLVAGGAYVPLDPRLPAARRAALVRDAGCAAVIGDAPPGLPAGVERWSLEDLLAVSRCRGETLPPQRATPGNLAYLLFTSGSTGRPKGVAVTHGSAAALVEWARHAYGDDEMDGVLAATPLGFDISVFELFGPLARGGRSILAPDVLSLPDLSARDEVRLVNTVPSVMSELLAGGGLPPGVRTVNLAGEPLPRELVEELFAAGVERVLNLYGPTEDTVYSTSAEMRRGDTGAPPIGRPLAGCRARVLDVALHPVALGVVGELALSGAGLARGYHGRPGATAERFVPDPSPIAPGERLYRTGDLVRRRADGDLLFLGRGDRQVKLRGVRIEPGEIEAALRTLSAVREAAVVLHRAAAGPFLAAYVVATAGETVDPAALRRDLAASLPAAMLPTAVVTLDELPRTTSGKLDRGALPEPRGRETAAVGAYAAPRNDREAMLVELWSELTGSDRVGVDDDFFALGGHSLLAVRLVARLRTVLGLELPLVELFRAPTPAALARRLESLEPAEQEDGGPIPRRAGEPPVLSFGQRRLWFFERVQPGTAAYNMPAAITLEGDLDVTALSAALSAVVARHHVLRTALAGDDEPRPRHAPPRPVVPPLVDLGALPLARREREARRLAGAEARRPVPLDCAPLVRAGLLRLDRRRHELLITAHHAAADGRSLAVFYGELVALYGAATRGGGDTDRPLTAALPELPLQYADFAAWQRRRWREAGTDRQRGVEYWRRRLAGAAVLDLPTDRPRPAVQALRGGVEEVPFAPALPPRLEAFARNAGATRFMVVLAAFQALLARYAGSDDVVVGVPVADRDRAELENLIGFFVNTVALRARPGARRSFADLVAAVRRAVLDGHAHRRVPLEVLVDELEERRSLSRNPLFQVTCAEEERLPEARCGALTLRPRQIDTGTAKFDLSLFVHLADGGALRLEYDRDLFAPETARRMLHHLHRLLDVAVENPQAPLGELDLLPEAERRHLLVDWNDTALQAPTTPVHLRVLELARRQPEAVALVAGGESLTYRDLARRAAALAGSLVDRGVRTETAVGLLVPRSPAWVVAQLAILLAGGTFVALDPQHPAPRLRRMLSDSAARVLLTTSSLAAGWREHLPTVDVEAAGGGDADPACFGARPGGGDAAAYIIFTSGSTGRPKGVAVAHHGLANLAAWHRRVHGVGLQDRTSQLAGLGFDASVWEVWSALANGATTYLAPEEAVADPPALVEWLRDEAITVAFLPTPLAEAVLAEPAAAGLTALRRLLTGGDRLRLRPADGLPFELVNHYGPTESTVVTTWSVVGGRGDGLPSIGRPVDNLRVYLLDRSGRLVPRGAPGELCIAGRGLARGYVGRPAETAAAFVPDPWSDGGRLYRSGDLARMTVDDELAFHGRIDDQTQLRGFRVEPGEVEAALRRHPSVREAAVVVRGDGPARRLVAYIVGPGDEAPGCDGEELRRHLSAELPSYMVPAEVVTLDALPLNASGKLERAALPEPAGDGGEGHVAPRSELERFLAGLWSEALGRGGIGVHDDFFALGGHSLLVTRLTARLHDELGVELTPRDLFAAPTIAGLSVVVAQRLVEAAGDDEVAEVMADLGGAAAVGDGE